MSNTTEVLKKGDIYQDLNGNVKILNVNKRQVITFYYVDLDRRDVDMMLHNTFLKFFTRVE